MGYRTAALFTLLVYVIRVEVALAGPKTSFFGSADAPVSLPSVATTAAVMATGGTALAVHGIAKKQSWFRSVGGIVNGSTGSGGSINRSTGSGGSCGFRSANLAPSSSMDEECGDASERAESSSSSDDSDCDSDGEGAYDAADADGADAADADGANESATAAPALASRQKLWTNREFPEGVTPLQSNWDMANLIAAQNWTCPCTDRTSCISADRLTVLQLYEYRKHFLTTCKQRGGKRGALASDLKGHYSSANRSLSRSFVVGPLNDCCDASAALAAGVSFQTYANARADVTLNRSSSTKARKHRRAEKISYDRSIIDAYVRRLRGTFEGSKGKELTAWYTGKRSIPKRWEDFKKHRTGKGLPIVGSVDIFREIWKTHDEIKEQGATGHPVCEQCGKNQQIYDSMEGRTDAAAVEARRLADIDQDEHDVEHRAERKYAEDIWGAAEVALPPSPPPHPRSHLSLVTTPIASGASGQDHGNEF